jgi:hypothetical protein
MAKRLIYNKARLWNRLFRAKSFILITEDEATMKIDIDPTASINESIVLASQRATLINFRDQIDHALRMFDTKLARVGKAKRRTGKAKQVPVK